MFVRFIVQGNSVTVEERPCVDGHTHSSPPGLHLAG